MLDKRQSFVLIWENIMLALVGIYLWIGYQYFPIQTKALQLPSQRLALAVSWLVIPVLSVIIGILAIQYQRFTTEAIDPIHGGAEQNERMQVLQRYLQNTMEQFVLFAVAHLSFAVVVEPKYLKLTPLMAFLFLFGRIVFLVGYLYRPMWRAPGYGLTFYPTLCVIFYSIYCLFK